MASSPSSPSSSSTPLFSNPSDFLDSLFSSPTRPRLSLLSAHFSKNSSPLERIHPCTAADEGSPSQSCWVDSDPHLEQQLCRSLPSASTSWQTSDKQGTPPGLPSFPPLRTPAAPRKSSKNRVLPLGKHRPRKLLFGHEEGNGEGEGEGACHDKPADLPQRPLDTQESRTTPMPFPDFSLEDGATTSSADLLQRPLNCKQEAGKLPPDSEHLSEKLVPASGIPSANLAEVRTGKFMQESEESSPRCLLKHIQEDATISADLPHFALRNVQKDVTLSAEEVPSPDPTQPSMECVDETGKPRVLCPDSPLRAVEHVQEVATPSADSPQRSMKYGKEYKTSPRPSSSVRAFRLG